MGILRYNATGNAKLVRACENGKFSSLVFLVTSVLLGCNKCFRFSVVPVLTKKASFCRHCSTQITVALLSPCVSQFIA